MTDKGLERSKRSGWLAGAVAGAGLVLATLFVHFSPDAQSAPEPEFGVVSFADVIEDVSPAVVNISVTKVERAMPTTGFGRQQAPEQFPFEFFERYFDFPGMPQQPQQPRERRSEGQGSGFVIDAQGHIVTNNHVIESADKITVTMQDGRKLDATLVGSDAKTDLALIKVDSGNLAYVEFGDSDSARVGEWVVAIGNPFGLGGTATAGIVSARGRDIQSGPYDDYLQLDAPINLGNSGGPVFDSSGRVVGVSTAIVSPNGGNVGIAFAIPANQAKAVIGEIKENGSVERGWLGVQIQDLDAELAASLGLDNEKGALVAEVLGDGPAQQAGVQAGDVVTRFDNHEIDSARTLSRVVGDADPSDTANLTVWRDGKSRELRVKLGEAARGEQVAAASVPGVDGETTLGLTLRALTDEDKAQLDLSDDTQGVLVANVEPNSAAAEKGIRAGDVITRVNQQDVGSVDDALEALADAREQDRALLLVKRGDGQRFVALSFS